MNKLLLIFAALLCLTFGKTNAQTITVTQPNGGESLYACQTYLIKWNVTGGSVSEYYDIDYSLDGGTIWTSVATNYNAPSHQLSWTVPNVTSTTVKVRVKDKNAPAIIDQSDANFSINIPVTVTAPNGGQTFTPLTTTNITWTANGTGTYVNIYYSIDGGSSYITVATNVLASNGTYTWTVPNNPSTTCFVKVQDAVTSCMNDVSNTSFTINPLTPTMTYPNGAEQFVVGQQMNITWNTATYYSNVRIDYSLDNGSTWASVVSAASNNGTYSWCVPFLAQNKLYNQCLIKVLQTSDLSRYDVSNAVFSVLKPCTVTYPNGGETFTGCGSMNIQSSGNVNGSCITSAINYWNYYYSTDGGATWTTLLTNYGSPSYNWSYGNSINSTNCKVRVINNYQGQYGDTSDAVFSILPSNDITVTSPNGGQSFTVGSVQTITWSNTVNVSGSYVVSYSSSAGSGTIANNITGNSCSWTVPNLPATDYRITVRDYSNSCRTDMSDANFTVLPQTPVMTYPNGAEQFVVGQQMNITWNSATYYSNVRIDYSLDNGTTWASVVTAASNNGTYSWCVPFLAQNKLYNQCLIKVLQTSDLSRYDVSNAVFSVVKPCTVTYPNGGETFTGCGSMNIQSSGYVNGSCITSAINYWNYYYSTDGGATWTTLLTNYGSPSYNWSYGNSINSTNCKVRVINNYQGQYGDTSDAVFSILPSNDITVTSPNGGQSFTVGSVQTITWSNTVNVSGAYVVSYSSSAGSGTIANNITGNSCSWTVPNLPATDYRITVRDYSNSCKTDMSDANFTVLPQTPVMTYPNGAEQFVVGQQMNITWNSATYYSNVRIDYSLDNGSTWASVVSAASNNGTYSWCVPFLAQNKLYNQCLIKVLQTSDLTRYDVSNAVFSVVKPCTVTYPNGGETFTGCGSMNIQSSGYVNGSCITSAINYWNYYYSTDGGATWTTLLTNYGSPSYNWSYGNSINSTNCKVRVINNYQGQYGDTSDAVFSILPSNDITVTSPNGGQTFTVGSVQTITWSNTVNVSGAYTVSYSSSAGSGTIANNITGNSCSWTVPNLPATDYRITVRDYSNSCKTDMSDANFTVLPQTPVMTYPNGAEQFVVGQQMNITWNSATYYSNVRIDYSLDNGTTWASVVTAASNNGTYSWCVPFLAQNKLYNQCLIKVLQTSDLTRYDVSNAVFSVVKPCTVTYPNGGETFTGCGSMNIQSSGYVNGSCITSAINYWNYYYSTDGGATWTTLLTNYGSPSYNWSYGNSINSTNCKVRVINNYQGQYGDTSDAVFSILPSNDITVTSPNGGQSFTVGSVQTITWSNTVNVSGSYVVSYSSSAGSGTIANNITGNSCSWTVPNLPATDYRITVRDYSNSCKTDMSDANFTVLPQTPVMTYPNGAEQFVVGQQMNITWNSATYYSNVRIDYSLDNGATWASVVTAASNNGTYSWCVPFLAQNKLYNQCLIKVLQTSDLTRYDVSNAVFSVIKPCTVTYPNGGETFIGCGSMNIQSSGNVNGSCITSAINYWNYYYSTDGGATWTTLLTNYGSPSYNWSYGNSINSTNCKVRVINNYQGQYGDTSDAVFSILPSNDITVTSPNGGESFAVGSNQIITWTNTAAVSGAYTVSYSSSAGSGTIANNITGNTTNWTVPNLPATDYRITVRDYSNSCKTDMSNANFTVLPQTPIMTAPNGGQTIYYGETNTITWNTATYYSNVKLELTTDGGATWTTIVSAASNNGSYSWTETQVNLYSTQCKVRVSQTSDLTRYDVSDAFFTIKPAVTVSTPNGGELLGGCTLTSITLDHTSVYTTYTIQYSLDNGASWTTLTSSFNTSSGHSDTYNWNLPNLASTQTLVKAYPNSLGTGYYDNSNAVFTITKPVTIINPNFGGNLQIGSVYNITWQSDGISNLYDIFYSTNGGGSWISIVNGYNTSTNTYAWTVPNAPSTNCLIKVRDNINTCKDDISDVAFTISSSAPPLTVTAPNGGENWTGCSTHNITWTETTVAGSYNIAYSTTNGASWTTIVSGYATTAGTYAWQLPNTIPTSQILVRVQNAITTTILDISDALLTLTHGVLTASNDTTLCPGTSVQLNVTGGTTYTWNPTSYITSSTIANPVCTPLGNVNYIVQSNITGCILADTVKITVNPNAAAGVTIAANPGVSICNGSSVTFTATPTNGGTTPSYQWKLNGTNVGTNSTTYTSASLANSDVVTCVMTSNRPCATGNPATSNALTMTVTTNVTPSVSIAASQTSICSGQNVTFTATPTNGGTTPSYQWKLNGVLVGPNAATYSTTSLVNNDVVSCVMTSNASCPSPATATSNNITITTGGTATPSVSISASANNVCSNTYITFTATSTNGGYTPVYQWKVNGTNVATGATYITSTLANNDVVTCVLTSSLACASPTTATSNSITMIIVGSATPTITIAPSANPVCAGTSVTFTPTIANGGSTPTYQWKVNGANVGTGSTYASSTLANNDVVTCVLTSNLVCASTSTATSNAVTMTINATSTPTISISTSPTTICAGTNATFTATIGNGGSTPAYQWKVNGVNAATTASFSTTTLANNDVVSCVLTSSNTCASPTNATSNNITMTVNAIPNVVATNNGPKCVGTSATLTATGASTFSWSPSTGLSSTTGSSVTATPGSTQTYTVSGTTLGCTGTATTTLTINALPTVSASNNGPKCAGTAATLTGSGATTYAWSPGSLSGTTVSVTPASTTTYTVTGTDGNGCVNTATTVLTINQLPNVVATNNGPICAGSSASLTVTGASSYLWSTTETTSTITVTPPSTATYTVTGTDANNCINTASTTVNVNTIPTITANNNGPKCAGTAATLTASGATTFSWSPSTGLSGTTGSTVTATPSSTQTYTVSGTTAGCTGTATTTLTINPLPTVSASNDGPKCVGTAATLTGSGATTYAWSPGSLSGTTVSVTPASTTTYTVTGTDGNGCVNTATTVLTINQLPNVVATNNGPICVGASATLNATGASSLLWSTTETTASIVVSPTSTATYTVTGTDANNCSNTASTTVVVNTLPIPTASSNSPVCANGTLTLTAGGGSSYQWWGPNGYASTQATPNISGVSVAASGTYHVRVTNANGCVDSTTTTVVINALPSAPVVTAGSATTFCAGGSVTLTSSYASGNVWSNSTTADNISVTANGSYTVTYTDANGCSATSAATSVTVNPLPLANAGTDATVCNGSSTTLNATGGSTYSWTPSTGLNATNIANPVATPTTPTNYIVTVTSALGCSKNDTVYVNVVPALTADAGTTASICNGSSTSLTATGGTTYSWSPSTGLNATNIANPTANPTVSTQYTVTVSANGCANVTDTVSVLVKATPTVTATNATICNGASATVTATGSPAGGTYLWSDNSTTTSITVSPTSTTTYTVAYTQNGCTGNGSSVVTVNQIPVVTAADISICNGSSGTLTAVGTPSGGTYAWSNGGTSASTSVNPTTSTPYTVTYTVNGCTSSVYTANVTVNPLPATPTITLAGSTLTSSSATGNQWYLNGTIIAGATSQNYSPSVGGTYTVTVTSNGCSATSTGFVYTVTTYCTPHPTSGTSLDDYIDGVALGTINNIGSGSTGGPDYTDYTATMSTNLARNSSNTINITSGNYTPDNYAAWIDYNADGDFADAGEKLGEFANTAIFQMQGIAFTVPITATLGNTRLRVRGVYGNSPLDPCIDYVYGETEDYKIIIDPVNTNTPLANFNANVTSVCAGATVNFTNTSTNGPISYSWTFAGGTPATSTATNPSVVYSAAGTYNVTLVATNAAGNNTMIKTGYITVTAMPTTPTVTAGGATTNLCPGTSVVLTSSSATNNVWAPNGATTQAITVTTAGSYTVTVGTGACTATSTATVVSYTGTSVLPFLENFEGATFAPTGWTIGNPNADGTWVSATVTNIATGTKAAMLDNFSVNNTGMSDYLYSPTVSLAGVTTPQLKFDVSYARYSATYNDTLQVLVSTNCGATWTSIYMKTGTTLATSADVTTAYAPTASSQWRTETISLASYAGAAGLRVAFRNGGGYGNNVYVDNVNITGTVQSVTANFTAAATTVCAGQTVAYTNTSTGSPTSYSWTFAGGTPSTSTAANPVVTYNTAGTYTTTLTASNGASTNTKTSTSYITVNANPATPTITQSGPVLTASAATSYQWYLNGTIIPGATTQSYTAAATGDYTVVVTNAAGCSATSTPFSFIVTGTVQYGNMFAVNVYPNPTNGLLTIELNNLNENEVEITVLNVVGQIINKEAISNYSGDYKTSFDLTNLANGVYFVKVVANGQTNIKRIIKQE